MWEEYAEIMAHTQKIFFSFFTLMILDIGFLMRGVQQRFPFDTIFGWLDNRSFLCFFKTPFDV